MTAPRCAVCGRPLHDPASRACGIGPTCARRLSGRTQPPLPLSAPILTPAPAVTGQLALTLGPSPRQIRRRGITDIPKGDLL